MACRTRHHPSPLLNRRKRTKIKTHPCLGVWGSRGCCARLPIREADVDGSDEGNPRQRVTGSLQPERQALVPSGHPQKPDDSVDTSSDDPWFDIDVPRLHHSSRLERSKAMAAAGSHGPRVVHAGLGRGQAGTNPPCPEMTVRKNGSKVGR